MKEATHGTAAVAKDHINTPTRKTVLQVLHSQSLFTELNLNYVIFFCRNRSVKNDCIFLVQWARELLSTSTSSHVWFVAAIPWAMITRH
jgi:hypothetical protein